MKTRLASILGVLAFSGVLVPWSAPQAAPAHLCAENQPATHSADGSYSRLPILIVIHRKRVDGAEEAQISTICFGREVYVNGNANEAGDMEFDAKTVTLAFRLGRDLKITRWRHSRGEGDQGGIRMVEEPDGPRGRYHTYELHVEQCRGNDCKDIPLDPQIINKPSSHGS
jgi:hypothetical protein